MRHPIATAVTALFLAPLATSVSAQSQQDEADQLRTKAVTMQEGRLRLVPAARLYQQEAELREPEDPRRVQALTTAAHLLFYAKKVSSSRRVMEQAADAALERGDVAGAADRFLNAAWLAHQQGEGQEVRRLARRAEVLASSQLLNGIQRQAILSRLTRSTAVGVR